ncbi:hypothetical protein AG1IA_04343 [Rhizoctonia solani AG-1 IA]|uniref:Uncharacterized protein n=1 Tax=Thanatephorus cucumeris (strain AG1-IA) TaxID=983506 RepID=L8WXW6_THACA|nr:hypothetical protein AG1IA_04343 [Rhizoctonia solani AG-1 IA]
MSRPSSWGSTGGRSRGCASARGAKRDGAKAKGYTPGTGEACETRADVRVIDALGLGGAGGGCSSRVRDGWGRRGEPGMERESGSVRGDNPLALCSEVCLCADDINE